MDTFELTSSTKYTPSAGVSLLARHLNRLRTAHTKLATELPGCWCTERGMPTDEQIVQAIDNAIDEAGRDAELRVSLQDKAQSSPLLTDDAHWSFSGNQVRILIHSNGLPSAATFPLTPMPTCEA